MNPFEPETLDRFQIILAAAKRGHALQSGLAQPQVLPRHPEEKVTLLALRELREAPSQSSLKDPEPPLNNPL